MFPKCPLPKGGGLPNFKGAYFDNKRCNEIKLRIIVLIDTSAEGCASAAVLVCQSSRSFVLVIGHDP